MGIGSKRVSPGCKEACPRQEVVRVLLEVGEVEAATDLTMRVEYGRTIHRVAEEVRPHIIRRVKNLLGLRVTEVNITVSDVFFPQEEDQQQQQ